MGQWCLVSCSAMPTSFFSCFVNVKIARILSPRLSPSQFKLTTESPLAMGSLEGRAGVEYGSRNGRDFHGCWGGLITIIGSLTPKLVTRGVAKKCAMEEISHIAWQCQSEYWTFVDAAVPRHGPSVEEIQEKVSSHPWQGNCSAAYVCSTYLSVLYNSVYLCRFRMT